MSFDRTSLHNPVSKFKARSKIKQTKQVPQAEACRGLIKWLLPTETMSVLWKYGLTANGWPCGSPGKSCVYMNQLPVVLNENKTASGSSPESS